MKQFAVVVQLLLALTLNAKKLEPWQDPEVFEKGRLPMRSSFITEQSQVISLNGMWKFHFSETLEGRLSGFESITYNDAAWSDIPVPGLWELNGWGDPVYLNVGYAWRGHYKNNPPFPPTEGNHAGQYRKIFDMDPSWSGKQICLAIGSATSNVRVWVNGKEIGYSEDSKLEARFDITKAVRPGLNVVALEVHRWCDGSYLEDQDFWRLSGITRGVWVYTREKDRLEDVNIRADMDGALNAKAWVSGSVSSVDFEVTDASGKSLSRHSVPVKNGVAQLRTQVSGAKLWSAEEPNLYGLKVAAVSGGTVRESTVIDFGFRSVEIKNTQLLVNGKPILIKGVDRHELSPHGGYIVSEAEMIEDIRIMKRLNINAVRTCHYPDDPLWLSLCDRYGLYVVDEGNIESHGMGYENGVTLAQNRSFRAAHLSRDQRMVFRDINHPSVIIWSLGNEAGNGQNFIDCYDWIKAYDPTRPVQFEQAFSKKKVVPTARNSDIACPMYMEVKDCRRYLSSNPPLPLIQCEYAHAMGNSMGNFKEYWDLIREDPYYQGGFIWDFADQALWKASDASKTGTGHIWAYGGDYNATDPSDGSFNCNGIIASDRSWHPHAWEVRYQHQNIHTSGSTSALKVYNENFFTDLSGVRMLWNIEQDGSRVLSGVVENLKVSPQESAVLDLGADISDLHGVVTLNVSYVLKRACGLLPAGEEIAYDQIVLQDERPAEMEYEGSLTGYTAGRDIVVFSGNVYSKGTACEGIHPWTATFDKRTGALTGYTVDRRPLLSSPLVPCFRRAVTENDLGANLASKMHLWRDIHLKVDTFEVIPLDDGSYQIIVAFEPIEGKARLEMKYRVYSDGTLYCNESMSDKGSMSDLPDLFRFGMEVSMPGRYSTLDFFGLGPFENYPDRSSAAVLGRYRQSVLEQYHYGYVRPQESGLHGGLRYFRVLDDAGSGIELTSPVDFYASALPFSIEDMDIALPLSDSSKKTRNNQRGVSAHSLELRRLAHENDRSRGTTWVHWSGYEMGVGGTNSWGILPLDDYMLHSAPREFSFTLKPYFD